MGKSNAKPRVKCPVQEPHVSHVWMPINGQKHVQTGDKVWCPGIEPTEHKHDWDYGQPIHRKLNGDRAGLGEIGVPWNGPFECKCGKSVWLHGGRRKRDLKDHDVAGPDERFPQADALTRILALKAKLDAGGPEALDAEDTAELKAIGEALVEAFKPLVEAFQRLFEQVSEYVTAFLDSMDPVLMAQLVELSKAHGEKPDAVDTISIVGRDGEVLDQLLLPPPPVAAVQAMALQEDTGYLAPLLEPEHDQLYAAQEAVKDPFREPFAIRFNPATGDARQNIPDTNMGYLGSVPVDKAVSALKAMQQERAARNDLR